MNSLLCVVPWCFYAARVENVRRVALLKADVERVNLAI